MKYKLVIPKEFLELVRPELVSMVGQIRIHDHWTEAMHKSGFLVEVKEPMTKEDWINKYNTGVYDWSKDLSAAWDAGRKNLLLEQDYNDKCKKENSRE